MRRTDRLYALVEELRARAPRPVSRARLAEHLEVTARTIERDVLALQHAGVPIWSQRGRGGGYAIDAQWSLPPLNFDATEALAVIAAVAAARSMPFAEAGRRAERKLLAAMTAGEAARARELASRLRLGSFGTPVGREVIATVERAVVDRRVVELGYRDRDGVLTSRVIEAHGLHIAATGSYLVGWCRLRDAGRAFRLDRIVSVRATEETAPERELDTLLDWTDDAVAPDAVTEGDTMPTKPATPRRRSGWGPPRKADHRTGSSAAFARTIAGRLAGVDASTRRGVTSFAIGGERFLSVDDEDDSAVFRRAPAAEHGVVLHEVGRDEVRASIEEAWASYASKRLVTGHRKRQAARVKLPAVTHDDIRRVVLELPGSAEGPIWGKDVGFLIGTEKKTRFARFGPPVGGRVGNLLPPDDEDTLVILRCEQRPELLESSADRFFTTPHYGAPGEPGGVIVRLSEHRGPAELEELAELLEDAWREAASPDLIAQRERERVT
jgi:predicted DNA-binding transcriptional regulator YafY